MSMVGQRDYTHAGPLRKNPEYEGDEIFEVIRDARPLTSEELDGDTLSFFPSNPDTNEVLRNYVQNPLPGQKENRILSMGFAPLAWIIQTGSGVDPLAIRNALSNAGVVFKKENGRKTVMRAHARQFMPQIGWETEYAAVDDGTDSGETTELFCPTDPLTQLTDPGEPTPTDRNGEPIEEERHDMTLGGDEQFELDIVFDDASAIPAQADLEIYMGAFLQVTPPIG